MVTLVHHVWRRVWKSSLRQDMGWLAIGTGAELLLGAASTVLLARAFSQEEIGDYLLALSWLAALAFAGLPGVSSAIITSVAREEGGTFRTAVRWETLGGIGGGLLLVCVGVWQSTASKSISLWPYVLAAVLYPLFVNDCGFQALIGQKRYRTAALVRVAVKTVQLTGMVIIAFWQWQIVFAFVWAVITQVISNAVLLSWSANRVGPRERVDRQSLRYGLNLTLSNLLLQPLGQAERLCVGIWFGLAELAVFAFGEMVYGYLRAIGNHTHGLYFPRVARLHGARVKSYLVRHASYWTAGMLGLACIGYAIFPTMYAWLIGPSFLQSATYAGWYALAFAVGMPNFFITVYLRHMRATRETYWYGAVRAPLQLGFLAVGFWTFGIVGLPLSRGLTVIVHALIGWLLVCGFEKRHGVGIKAPTPHDTPMLPSMIP